MADIEVRGAEQFLRLSKALKAAGETEMRKQLHKTMRDTAKPLVKEARQAATESGIPKSGGLAARIAKTAFRPQVRTGATTAGVRITAPGKAVAARTLNDSGIVRHPVYAQGDKTRREWTWRTQSVPAAQGWFDRAMKRNAGPVRLKLLAALDQVRREILRSTR